MLYDSHTHTTNSDGRNTLDEMCQSAIEAGVSGLMITDHADMNFYESRDTYNRIDSAIKQIRQAQVQYKDKLELLCGVELGEYCYAPEKADRILQLTNYDAVLCSVHLVPAARWEKPYNRIVFSEDGTDKELAEYIRLYLELLTKTVDSFDFQILAHIACPVRYMSGKYGRNIDMLQFEPLICEILGKIIQKGVALEYNAAGQGSSFDFYKMQCLKIFEMYYNMGGRLITLGSDAHQSNTIAGGFKEANATLKRLGFEYYHYYKQGKPCTVKL